LAISTTEFTLALESLKDALDMHKTEIDQKRQLAFRDTAIQRFEYCIELAWKVSMKHLGSSTAAAKPAIREMARNNLINNPELWLTFVDARNMTSHSYDNQVAEKVFTAIQQFLPEAQGLNKILANAKQ